MIKEKYGDLFDNGKKRKYTTLCATTEGSFEEAAGDFYSLVNHQLHENKNTNETET